MTVFTRYETTVIFTHSDREDLAVVVSSEMTADALSLGEFMTLCRAAIRQAYRDGRIKSCRGWQLFEVLPSKAVSFTADDQVEVIHA